MNRHLGSSALGPAMLALRLALRTLLLGRSRGLLAVLLVAGSLCVLDLFAGHVASVRACLEHQAVIGERLGHLSIVPGAVPHLGGPGTPALLTAAEAALALRLADSNPAVALAMPQMSVHGVASSATSSALFVGEGIVAAPAQLPSTLLELPGKLRPEVPNGIAVGSVQAEQLGLRTGSNLTLSAASPSAPARPLQAEVIDVTNGHGHGHGQAGNAILMPFALAQSLLGTGGTERVVVYLHDPAMLDQIRAQLGAALRAAGVHAQVLTWQEQSASWITQHGAAELAFDSIAGMVFAVIGATIAATMSMNALERRREVATLRALGMGSIPVFLMLVAEALWMALAGVALSLVGSGLIAWIINRVSLSGTVGQVLGSAPMMVELDFQRMLMAIVAVLAVTLLASLVPAFRAARAPIAPALAALPF